MIKDGRRNQRKPVALKVRFKSATLSDFIENYSRDVSKGGIFIKMKKPMPVGTLIKFDFQLQDENEFIQGVGRVVWRREEAEGPESPAGMGIKFIKLDEMSKKNLDLVVEGRDATTPFGQRLAMEEEQSTLEGPGLPRPKPRIPPPGAKGTMLGVGPGPAVPRPAGLRPIAATPAQEPDAPEPVPGPSTPTEAGAPTEKLEAVDRPAKPAPAHDTAPADGQVADSQPAKPVASVAAKPAEKDFLADISSAIDTALGGEHKEEAEAAAPAERVQAQPMPGMGEESGPVVTVARDAEQAATSDEEEEERPTAQLPRVETVEPSVVPPAPAKPEAAKRGGFPVITAIAATVVLGIAAWFLFIGPGEEEAPAVDEQQTTITPPAREQPVEEVPAEQEPAEQPADEVATGSIEVKTSPAGATVLVDGTQHQGVAPLTVNRLTAGKEVELTVKLFGHVSSSQTVVPGDEPVPVEFSLKPAKMAIELKSDPSGAGVLVDGDWLGKTGKTIVKKDLKSTFAYVVEKKGYISVKGQISEGDWKEEDGVFRTAIDVTLARKAKEEKPKTPTKKKKSEREKPPAEKPQPVAEKPPAEKPETEKPKTEKPKKEKPKEEKPKPPPKPSIDDNPF